MNSKLFLLVVGAGAGIVLTSPSATAQQILHGHVPEAVARMHLQPVGRLSSTNRLALAIGLPLRNQTALTNLLHQIYDPASPNYHHYLTPEQFTEQFGPTEKDCQAVMAFAKANGLRVTGTHPNRMLVNVSGSVADIQKAMHVTMCLYQHPTEARTFYAPDVEPSVPAGVAILDISGLNSYSRPHPNLIARPIGQPAGAMPNGGSGPGGSYMGYDFRTAYATDVLLTGAGQTVELAQFDGYYPNDIAAYESQAGLPDVTLTNVLLDGVSGIPGYGGVNNGVAEVSLDIEMAISMAPGLSKVIVYEGYFLNSVLNGIVTDNLAKQISMSWGWSGGPSATTDQILQQMAAQGQTFFVASGDYDAYYPPGAVDDPDNFGTPAASPYVTSVGGTTLTMNGTGGSYASETVWNRGNGIGSGGGVSTYYSIPYWQQGVSMSANQGSTTGRNIPDVALTAENIYVIYNNGSANVFGGTSCASPLWAGFTALVNQQAAASGGPAVGFINPAIYAIGSGVNSVNYTSAFHDITTGDITSISSPTNYYAVTGYDLCTGWGTPAGQNLINALSKAEALLITPFSGFTSSGNPGGPFTVTSQSLTVTNLETNSLSWSLSNTSSWLNVSTNGGTLTPGGASATVMVSLDPAAGDLPPGTYTATLWFTDLDDSVVQGRTFTLIALGAPVMAMQPQNQLVMAGGTATFTISATGATPLSYSWLKNGGYIAGATNATFTTTNAQMSDSGSLFSCVVTNVYGAITSSVASLTVFGLPWHLFDGPDGARPCSALVQGSDGNFYGTTVGGGDNDAGTVFKMTTNGALTTLVSFDAANGACPAAGLVAGNDGNFYGTTQYGGDYGYGTIFRMTTNGALTTLVSFNGTNGSISLAGLVQGTDGNFYGTTAYGGTDFNGDVQSGNGTVFRMTPNGLLTTLVLFDMTNNGAGPECVLVQARDGNFYGTTLYPDGPTYGTIFRMTTNGVLTTLVAFNLWDGVAPYAGLVQGNDGYLYGTTAGGGAYFLGTVFRVTTNGLLTTLVSFDGTNGMEPQAALVQGSDGNFYGVTSFGGPYGDGTVFSMASDGTLHTLLSFAGINGFWPAAALVQGRDGNFYGTTAYGGNGYDPMEVFSGNGIVFRLVPPPSPPVIIVQPLNQTAVVGSAASFSISAIGSEPLNYQWQFLGTNIPGATSTNYTVADVTAADAGGYAVIAANDYGSATSHVAVLTVLPAVLHMLGLSTYDNRPVVFFPTAKTNYVLQMTTDPASGNWVTVTNGIPFSGLQITNNHPAAFFRLNLGVQTVTRIAGGGTHSLFLKNDGSLWAMGNNQFGQLGDGTFNGTNQPEQIVTGNVTAIAGGGMHSLFLECDGSLWAMGDNGFGELGDGTSNSTNQPEQIVASNVTAIAAGWIHSLFLKSNGSLWGMGNNQYGQLGLGSANYPEQIVAGNVTAIAAGFIHSLFLKSNGSLWAMGDNQYGQLGDGTTNNAYSPEMIVADNVTAIAAGQWHSLFLKSDGSLSAMGYNADGELGDGTSNSTNQPEQIVASNVTAVAAGEGHSLFLKNDGSLWAMGLNYYGQLGDGNYNNTYRRPQQIVASNVTAIAAGEGHSLFLMNDGSLWAMGWNYYGQLGDGTYSTVYPYGPNRPEQIVAVPVLPTPVLGVGTYGSQPVVFFPSVATPINYWLLMTTDLASGNWVTVTNGIPFSGLEITNAPSPVYFRLY